MAKLKTGATFSVAAKAPLCAANSFTESMLWNQGILSEKRTVSWLVIGHLGGKTKEEFEQNIAFFYFLSTY